MLLRPLLALCGLLLPLPGQASALDLRLPGNASLSAEQSLVLDSYAMPIGAFANGALPVQNLEGRITRQAWRISAQGLTSLQILDPLRRQLADAGYVTLFECEAAACGGFDFRFGTEVLPAPDMYVDLTDYRFLAVGRGEGDHLTLLVSSAANVGYVQLIHVTDGTADAPEVHVGFSASPGGAPNAPSDPESLEQRMVQQGHVVLDDLTFDSGSSSLGAGQFATLAALAQFLLAQPDRRVALVGHTDAVGGLDANISLSKRRAASVLERLVSAYGVPRAQLEAEGMGYLSPIAPNQTDIGREANRRVEAVLLNTD
ncbi:OmpA family protein [Thalassovita taeanensis]|uniref:OmpA-OmpF porin, OOP family n=1 Tax=Thalassovita taeanensis TaxID=657014 RepID=A0A1H9IHN8_9RHOB|nr:OmpA family protein [Thalassovita taeanensis]SEQ74086.1 OmpA-OmpF porin, OOP family [Thalassovita taeanensis]